MFRYVSVSQAFFYFIHWRRIVSGKYRYCNQILAPILSLVALVHILYYNCILNISDKIKRSCVLGAENIMNQTSLSVVLSVSSAAAVSTLIFLTKRN